MFKKLLFGGMAMLIAITAIFSTAPALAGSPSKVVRVGDDPYPGSPIVTVTQAVLAEIYPPLLAISGTINNSCYTPRATTPRVVFLPDGRARIVIGLAAVPVRSQLGQVCTQQIRNYRLHVTLDRAKLGLPVGRYQVAISPGNGVRPFITSITLR